MKQLKKQARKQRPQAARPAPRKAAPAPEPDRDAEQRILDAAHAAFERAASQFMPAVIQVLASDEELDAKVTRIVELELDHLARAPFLPGYIISEVTHHPERARQLIASVTGRAPEDLRPQVIAMLRQQIGARVRRGTMRPIAPEQFIVNLMSLCIFPFAARPMISAMLGMDQTAFEQF